MRQLTSPSMRPPSTANDGALDNHEVLLAEGYDQARDFSFYRPLGGSIKFGELIEDSAHRELNEELGLEKQNLEFINFHESLFMFEGEEQHKLVFHFSCKISNEARFNLPAQGMESGGEVFPIAWFTEENLNKVKANIVPLGIYDEIRNML